MPNAVEDAKRRAAERAIEYIRSETTVGLGTGSTMRYAVEELGRRLASGTLHTVSGVSTSNETTALATRCNIPIVSLERGCTLALAIDGADEVDSALNLIKGRGGALLREKIVAASSSLFVIVVDESKMVETLGSLAPIPIEVIPFALPLVLDRVSELGGHAHERKGTDAESFRTDEGNAIIDYASGPLDDPARLGQTLHNIPGVVGHGLFLGMAHRAVIAGEHDIRIVQA